MMQVVDKAGFSYGSANVSFPWVALRYFSGQWLPRVGGVWSGTGFQAQHEDHCKLRYMFSPPAWSRRRPKPISLDSNVLLFLFTKHQDNNDASIAWSESEDEGEDEGDSLVQTY